MAQPPKNFVELSMRCLFLALIALSIPNLAQAAFGLHVGGHFGYGNMGNESTDADQARSVGTFDVQAMPGLRALGNVLLVGLMLDYRFHSQLKDDDSLVPYSGRSFLLGPGVALDLSFGKLLFSYDILTRHYYTGPETTLKGSGFHILAGYKVMGNLSVDLEYVVSRYSTVDQYNGERDLGEFPIKHKNLGFGLSWIF